MIDLPPAMKGGMDAIDEVVSLTRADAAMIGEIIADAFQDDPVMVWALGGTAALRPVNTLLARHIYLTHGFGHRSTDGAAGTLWMPPDARADLSMAARFTIAGALVRHGGLTGLKRAFAVGEFLAASKPKDPHYYLYAIGVRSGNQGRGLGGKMMRAGLALADAAGMPAYLENSKERNLSFYRAHGFEVIRQETPAPGCPPMWPMWREARPV